MFKVIPQIKNFPSILQLGGGLGGGSSNATGNVYDVYANLASFPVTGIDDLLYIANDTKLLYYWTGSIYVETSPGAGGGDNLVSEGALINSAVSKATPVDADMVGLMDSAAANLLKKLSWANIKATLKTYFDAIYLLVTLTAPANDDFIQRKAGLFVNRTVAQVKTDLGITGAFSDIAFTQPSASTSWVLVHGRAIKPNFAYFNASGQRETPLEDASVAGQVTLTFGASEIHTATLPGNGTSASIRNDNIISILASAINTASGVIDIVTARTINVIMDANITFAITFSTTPADGVPLTLAFIKTTPLYTAVPLDGAKFQGSVSNPMPAPFITATLNTKDTLDFRYYANKSKMSLTGADLGA